MAERQKTLSLAIWLDKIISPIERICLGVAGVALVLIAGLTTVGVIARYYFHSPLSWSIQLSEYALLMLVFLPAPWLMRFDKHISSELLLVVLPKRILGIVHIINLTISTIVSTLIFWFALEMTIEKYSKGVLIFDVIQVPMYLPLAVVTLGSFLLSVRCLERTFHRLSHR